MAEIEKALDKVKSDKLALKVSDRLKGNSVLKYLEFKTLDNGRLLVSLNPKYKATEQSKKEFKQDFLKIQEILPDLAREIKDYQLLRYGLNNRMGSFIDGLPMDMNIKGLKRASTLINNPYSVNKNSGVIRNNLVQKNKDLLKVVSDNQIEMHNGKFQTNRNSKEKYLVYNNEVYSKGVDGNYAKTFEGKFETDENFTRYNLSNFEVKATKEQAITKLENCK
jgi:phage repressor protein C with HTH and peptisase S24 domain